MRRIEALTGDAAVRHVQNEEKLLADVAGALKVSPAQLIERIETIQNERKKLEKEIAELKRKSAGDSFDEENLGAITFISKTFDGLGANDVRGIAEDLRQARKNSVILFFGVDGGKVSIVSAVTDDIKDKFQAPALAKAASEATGGKGGGGRPELAQAGGVDAGKIADALNAAKNILQ